MLIDKEIFKKMLLTVTELWKQESDRLSEIDSRFGDGDHGVTIKKIALLIEKKVSEWEDESLYDFIDGLGESIMGICGGSAGPLYGTMIGGLAAGLDDASEINEVILKNMLSGSLEAMQDISNAKVGDKTMMDSLIPAVEAANAVEGDIFVIIKAAADAAEQGAKDSEGYVSKFGRARSYKEQTIGTPDAGAVSTALFFKGFSEGCKQL